MFLLHQTLSSLSWDTVKPYLVSEGLQDQYHETGTETLKFCEAVLISHKTIISSAFLCSSQGLVIVLNHVITYSSLRWILLLSSESTCWILLTDFLIYFQFLSP